jgi:crossover junction endodeoxyribonuclease RusA
MGKEYLIRLPWPPAKSSPNGSQGDYRGKARAGAAYKATCGKVCMEYGVRRQPWGGADVSITFHPPTARAYDLDNALAKCKRGLDALSEAVGVDDADWLSMTLHRGEKVKGGCVLVHLKEAAK